MILREESREESRGKQKESNEQRSLIYFTPIGPSTPSMILWKLPSRWEPQRAQNNKASHMHSERCIACMPPCCWLPRCEVLSCVLASRMPSSCVLPSCAPLSSCTLAVCCQALCCQATSARLRSAAAIGTAAEAPGPETCAHTRDIRELSTSTQRVRGNRRACDSR